tara:strand:+ start:619 stop:966 length:348 start_codon:yes stop_codon:yes gene_type:complete
VGNIAYIEENIRGLGADHDGMFDEVCGDAFPVAGWPNGSPNEGDSPTLLHLLSPVFGGVGDVDDPTVESWGGQYYRPEPDKFPNYCTDLDADDVTCQSTIVKWRVDYLTHWKERW